VTQLREDRKATADRKRPIAVSITRSRKTEIQQESSSIWRRVRPFIFALTWALLPSIGGFYIASSLNDAELKKVIYAGAATLIFGGFLGGVLKIFLDEVVATKRRQEDAAGFVAKVLSDLKDVFDGVARARTLIPAHRSVSTYGDEMRDMIEARVQLRNVTRALERRAEGVSNLVRSEVTNSVTNMGRYLDQLIREFRENYKSLSDRQRGYEERAKIALRIYAEGSTELEPPHLPTYVWDRLSVLPMLSDFIGEGELYKEGFEKPLDYASEKLRNEHARILRS
jgi:hypothetical protein